MMKASEVIKRLHFLMRRDGDFEVRIYDACDGQFVSVHEIEPRRFLDSDSATVEERARPFIGIDPYAIGDTMAQLRYDNTPYGTKTL